MRGLKEHFVLAAKAIAEGEDELLTNAPAGAPAGGINQGELIAVTIAAGFAMVTEAIEAATDRLHEIDRSLIEINDRLGSIRDRMSR